MKKELFNDGWKFWEDKDSFALVWSVPESAKDVILPHDAMLINGKNEHSKNWTNTGFRDGGVYNYAKFIKPTDENKTYIVHFEGVYMNALVYVNQQLAANCPYGYTGFDVRLNDFLKFGEENEIRVSVRNSAMTNSRWYSGSGIYRDCYMLTAGETYFEYQGSYVNTEAIDDDFAAIKVTNTIVNRGSKALDTKLLLEIVDADKKVVASANVGLAVFENESQVVETRITVPNPKLWDDENPNLYTLRSKLYAKDELIDEDETGFGIRTISVDARHGFRVNGVERKLRGACIHHDNGIMGAVTMYENEYRRVKLLKEAGFNAIRMAHNPAAPALLKACDELGMYVMDEAFDMWTRCKSENDYALWFTKWWKNDIEAMVKKDRLSPSVVFYSIGNEIPEIGEAHGARLCKDIAQFTKSLDPTRFTIAAINGVFAAGSDIGTIMADLADGEFEGGNVNQFMQIMDTKMHLIVTHRCMDERLNKACAGVDIAGYNYMTARYEKDLKENPDRVIVGSETYGPQIPMNWDIISRQHNVIGDFTWTGWDYIGEAGVGVVGYKWGEGGFGAGYPKQLAYVGDLDINGFRRPCSYFREIVFGLRKNPYIVTQNPYKYGEHPIMTPWVISDSIASWTYPDMVGKPIVVEIYSAGDSVELFKNKKSLGKTKVEGFIARFETTYEAGMLEAVSYDNDKEIGRSTIATADNAKLVAEESYKNGTLSYVNIARKSANGEVDTHENKRVEVKVDGALEYRLGNGGYEPEDNYITDSCDLFIGRALLIVRKAKPSDKVNVEISCDGDVVKLTV